jgi:hypothetical protein
MTDHVVRLYAIAFALLVFFFTWAAVAARPWGPEAEATAKDPRVAALDRRAERLERRRARVQRMLDRRFAEYRRELRERQALIAAVQSAPAAAGSISAPSVSAPSVSAPSVATVSAPPATSTRSS